MRMIAGPNGSGKSTLIELLAKSVTLGIYINADDIEANLIKKRLLHFEDYSLNIKSKIFLSFLKKKTTIGSDEYKKLLSEKLLLENNILVVPIKLVDSYLASLVADFMRHQLLKAGVDFSFETVMSHPSKIDFLKLSNINYRTYFYFVATNDPLINIERIKTRVIKGGHFVNEDKIIERYKRSIDLLHQGLRHAYRCFIFDNTTSLKLIAEFEKVS